MSSPNQEELIRKSQEQDREIARLETINQALDEQIENARTQVCDQDEQIRSLETRQQDLQSEVQDAEKKVLQIQKAIEECGSDNPVDIAFHLFQDAQGYLTRESMRNALLWVPFAPKAEESIQELISQAFEFDTDNDGKLSKADFQRLSEEECMESQETLDDAETLDDDEM